MHIKLTPQDVMTIRREWSKTTKLNRSAVRSRLARTYNVTEDHILRVANNRSRKEPFVHHYYIFDSKQVDLSKVQEEARNRLDGNGIFRGAHEESVIHHHPKAAILAREGGFITEGGRVPCDGYEHEEFRLAKS